MEIQNRLDLFRGELPVAGDDGKDLVPGGLDGSGFMDEDVAGLCGNCRFMRP